MKVRNTHDSGYIEVVYRDLRIEPGETADIKKNVAEQAIAAGHLEAVETDTDS